MLSRRQAMTRGIDVNEANRMDLELVRRGILSEGQSAFVEHQRIAGRMNYGPDTVGVFSKLQHQIGLRGDDLDGDFGPQSTARLDKVNSRTAGNSLLREPVDVARTEPATSRRNASLLDQPVDVAREEPRTRNASLLDTPVEPGVTISRGRPTPT